MPFISSKERRTKMEKSTDTTEYEAPRIEDHGNLAELTAAGHVGVYADAEVTLKKGESLAGSGHAQSSP
jgi:hypothetical protein